VIDLAKQGNCKVKIETLRHGLELGGLLHTSPARIQQQLGAHSPTRSWTPSRKTVEWELKSRMTAKRAQGSEGHAILWDQIVYAAWSCADPGVQFDTTINEWHTCPRGRSHQRVQPGARSTCSSTTRLVTSRRLNLLTFYDEEDGTSTSKPSSTHAAHVDRDPRHLGSDGAVPEQGNRPQVVRQFRTLGLGYANIGASADGAWASPTTATEGRAIAASITAIMTAA
jgi:ribonucleoside-diphosphate reductase alpha chain